MTQITSNFFTFEAGHLVTFAFVLNIQKPLFIFRCKSLLILMVYAANFSSAQVAVRILLRA